MLSLVVNDALDGVDIARRYPVFYRRLLADPRLRWAFLEALEILGKEEDGELDSLPASLDIDLPFLERTQPLEAMVETKLSGSWRLSWQRPIPYLQSRLIDSFAPADPTNRSPADFLEDDRITLVDGVVEVAGDEIGVLLEFVRPAGAPDVLHLSLFVTAGAIASFRATVEWGNFRETARVAAFGGVTFPPLSLADLLDDVGQKITAALCLTVEPAAP